MNNLYHKIAFASACTDLGFALGANEEAYSATFTGEPSIIFEVIDYSNKLWNEDYNYFYYEYDRVGDWVRMDGNSSFGKIRASEGRLFAEFNIDSFSSVPNEDINRVLLQTQLFL